MLSLNSLDLLDKKSSPHPPLNVSDIQYFSVGDGDGIRTTLFLKGCNLRCPWCHNPETISPERQELCYENGRCVTYGREMTAEELLPLLVRDKEFFTASGGGVTVSGGEPLLQSRSLVPLLKMLKDADVHVIIDTACSLPESRLDDVIDLADCFFVDYKSPREEVYRRVIGGSLESVETNIKRILAAGKDLHARIPLIPGVNDSCDDAEMIAARLSRLGVKRVDLLPFHRLGSGKYTAMGLEYVFQSVSPPDKEVVGRIADILGRHFTVTVEK